MDPFWHPAPIWFVQGPEWFLALLGVYREGRETLQALQKEGIGDSGAIL
jgi:hypothetical protein